MWEGTKGGGTWEWERKEIKLLGTDGALSWCPVVNTVAVMVMPGVERDICLLLTSFGLSLRIRCFCVCAGVAYVSPGMCWYKCYDSPSIVLRPLWYAGISITVLLLVCRCNYYCTTPLACWCKRW